MQNTQPLVQLIPVEAVEPSLQDNTGDLDRLRKALSVPLHGRRPFIALASMEAVARGFRQASFKGLAVINELPAGPELVDFLPKAPPCLPAMALDLGTTHLEASLIDLVGGAVLARAALENTQAEYGADILARIHFAARGKGEDGGNSGLAELHGRVIGCVNDLARELAGRADIRPAEIRALSVAGNTTMVHFFLKLDPYHLCREPYIPMVNSPDPCRADELGLAVHPAAPVWVLPSVGSYFGGDLIAGIMASGLDRGDKTCMLIDVGTNAEVVVGNRDWLVACAGAAGPALEGGVTRVGMQAGPGALEHISIDPETGAIDYSIIGGEPARGICGSGIIELVADMYLARIIDVQGKFKPGRAAELVPGRMIDEVDGPAFVVVPGSETAAGEPVALSQVDLDALMRSKAAMYSILSTLINQVGLTFAQLDRIYVAGAFGKHISPRHAVTLGMLPDLPLATYESVGNSSLAGAEMILLDRGARERCSEVVKKITYIELNVNQEFMIRFSGCRFIPHTDRSLFPSVPFFNDN